LRNVRWLGPNFISMLRTAAACLSNNEVKTVNNLKITLAKTRRQSSLINTYLYITLATVGTN
jgi:hypothetical protein